MKLNRMQVKNYRTLGDVDLRFPNFYTAVCGKNDSGKTNIVRALRHIAKPESPFWGAEQPISLKEDFTRWSKTEEKNRKIELSLELAIDDENDAGLLGFLIRQLSLLETKSSVELRLSLVQDATSLRPVVTVTIDDREYKEQPAEEVLGRLRTSQAFLFHNSTELLPPELRRSIVSNLFREMTVTYGDEFASMRDAVNKRLKRINKGHQEQLNELMARLESKHKVGLAVAPFDFDYLPYNLTLGKGSYDVALDEWGSGTINRTLVLVSLLRAKSVGHSLNPASKLTPILVLEEPESFLHPSAQAEFGKLLQELSQELKVQVIVTTHSPYMLSLSEPEGNVLLDRREHRKQFLETRVVPTIGCDWMVPFGLALGIDNEEFEPWKEAFFSQDKPILLVEGETDKEYLELLRRPEHGVNRLKFTGDIYAYNGRDNLKNGFVMKFLRERCKKLFVTFDLDAKHDVEPKLTKMGFLPQQDCFAFGVDSPGKRDIEGHLPDSVKNAVRTANTALVDQLSSTDKDESRDAKQRLKKLYLDEFRTKTNAAKGSAYEELYRGLYDAAKKINKLLMCL